MDISTEQVEIPVEDAPAMAAHVARPTGPGTYPVIVVAPEIFGLSPYIREVTERVAGLGYVAVAPNFYHRDESGFLGEDEAGRTRAFELVRGLTRPGVLADVQAAFAYVGAPAKAGMLGLSSGGHLAYLAAAELGLDATAVFYGGWLTSDFLQLGRPEPTIGLTPKITGKLLYLVGDQDHAVPREDYEQVGAALIDAGVDHELVVYPGIGHGFFAHNRGTYRPEIADDAWGRVRELFAERLG